MMAFSAVYPWLLDFVPPGQLMGATFILFSTLLLAFSGTSSALWAQAVVILMGLPMAALLTIPVAITVENSDETNRGKYLGALNCFAVIPQLIDTLYVGLHSATSHARFRLVPPAAQSLTLLACMRDRPPKDIRGTSVARLARRP